MIGASSYRRAVGLLLLIVSGLGALPLSAERDAEMEDCLAEGKILEGWEELPGYTRSLKLTLDCDGREQVAVFKSLDIHEWGKFEFVNGDFEFNFTDCYKYEVAAYLLDRELDLGMVPVAVVRRHRRKEGAMVAWIFGAVHENLVTRAFNGPETASLARQMSIVRMFDSLIYNVDRRPPNILVDESGPRVFMIDHGRSFREKKKLQEGFEENRVWLRKESYTRLKALDSERVNELLKGLLSKGQRRMLLKRRELIIEKIDRDRREYGDEAIFIGPDVSPGQSSSTSSIE